VLTGVAVTSAVAAVLASTALAGRPKPSCVSTQGLSNQPTTEAPSWYQPGVTQFCGETTDRTVEPMTAYWVYYEDPPGYPHFRTTPANADYSANDCVNSYTTCGTQIIGDAQFFYESCTAAGLSASTVATNIRYWADRARANGTNWRVYTYEEGGGYPYACKFSVVAL